jgi:peptidylprolyl isomerase
LRGCRRKAISGVFFATFIAGLPFWLIFQHPSSNKPLEPSVSRIAISLVLALFALAATARAPALAQAPDPQNTLVVELKTGNVLIKLRPDIAPKHVERAKTLARQGFYNGLKFHRVIDGFMAQTGDPTGTGMGGSKLPDLPLEVSRPPEVYKRGSIGAARTQDPNTANSQFFICFNNDGCRGLTGQYTIWGEVIEGMEHVDKITRGEPPRSPDVMLKVYVQADAPK